MFDFDKLASNLGNLQEDDVLQETQRVAQEEPERAADVLRALAKGMDIIGDQFDGFEYFVGDLIFAGGIFTRAMDILRPVFPVDAEKKRGKVLLATAEGDLHDIGKNMVKITLQSKGFDIIDLGVNVAPSVIVSRAISEDVRIVGLSAVLTSAVDAIERTVEAFCAANFRDQVTIIIGGAGTSESVAKKIKVDYYAKAPEDTADICLALEQKAGR